MKRQWLFLYLPLLLFSTYALNGFSQQTGDVTLGLQIGRPTGISLKYFNPSQASVDVVAAWDLDEFFFLNAHGIFEMDVGGADALNFFYGPGAFFSIEDNTNRRSINQDLSIGISATAGLNYWLNRFELYIRLTPRLSLIKATEANVGGGFGIRYLL